MFQAEISSFALRLAAEGKAAKTIRTYTEAVQWFAATGLPGQASRAGWEEQVSSRDIRRWMAWLLDATAPPTPATSTASWGSSSNSSPPKTSCPTRWPGWPPRVPAGLVPVFTPRNSPG
jgi:hypothetical protein